MEGSNLGYQTWAIAIYLMMTSLKSVSSMKLHRDLGITQKSAWFLAHRVREAWKEIDDVFLGPVEADEAYFGGRRKNMHKAKLRELRDAGPLAGKAIVAGVKDRQTNKVSAGVVPDTTGYTTGYTLQTFVEDRVAPDATVYTDESRSYKGLIFHEHESVNHTAGEYAIETVAPSRTSL